jgi:hypothetical protein
MRDAGPLGRFLSTRVPAVMQFAAGALLMIGFIAQRDLLLRGLEFAAFLLLARLSGRRLRIVSYLLVAASVVAFNLIIPVGRELFSILGYPVTESALKTGVAKALTLVGMIAASQFSIRSDLRLPGRFGGLLGRSLLYFQRIMAERRRVDRRDIMGSIDTVLMDVHGTGAVTRDDTPPVPARLSGVLVLAGIVCLTCAPLAVTVIMGRAPFWGR